MTLSNQDKLTRHENEDLAIAFDELDFSYPVAAPHSFNIKKVRQQLREISEIQKRNKILDSSTEVLKILTKN